MPADHEVIRDDAQGEDRLDESTVAVIDAARQSARECTETYERIMSLLAEDEPLTGHDAGARKQSKRRHRTRTETEDGSPDQKG